MEGYIGEIRLVAYDFAPVSWMPCKGQILPIQHHEALYSLLGTNYGGDGHTTFGIPKLDSPSEYMHYVICVDGLYPSRF